MYLTIITLPLLGSIASGFLGRKLGVTGAQIITTSLVRATARLLWQVLQYGVIWVGQIKGIGLTLMEVIIHLIRSQEDNSMPKKGDEGVNKQHLQVLSSIVLPIPCDFIRWSSKLNWMTFRGSLTHSINDLIKTGASLRSRLLGYLANRKRADIPIGGNRVRKLLTNQEVKNLNRSKRYRWSP